MIEKKEGIEEGPCRRGSFAQPSSIFYNNTNFEFEKNSNSLKSQLS